MDHASSHTATSIEGKEDHMASHLYLSKKTDQSIKKWAALNLKDTIQNTYLTSYSVALRFYNSLPCADLLG